MTIGEKIRRLREEKGITQTELAKRIGINKQSVYKYETGIVTNIPSDKIEAIANVLGTSPSYIMGWNGAGNFANNNDIDIRRIQRARKNMSDDEKERMMAVLKKEFDIYFSDGYENGENN